MVRRHATGAHPQDVRIRGLTRHEAVRRTKPPLAAIAARHPAERTAFPAPSNPRAPCGRPSLPSSNPWIPFPTECGPAIRSGPRDPVTGPNIGTGPAFGHPRKRRSERTPTSGTLTCGYRVTDTRFSGVQLIVILRCPKSNPRSPADSRRLRHGDRVPGLDRRRVAPQPDSTGRSLCGTKGSRVRPAADADRKSGNAVLPDGRPGGDRPAVQEGAAGRAPARKITARCSLRSWCDSGRAKTLALRECGGAFRCNRAGFRESRSCPWRAPVSALHCRCPFRADTSSQNTRRAGPHLQAQPMFNEISAIRARIAEISLNMGWGFERLADA